MLNANKIGILLLMGWLIMGLMACSTTQKITTKNGKKMTTTQAFSYAYGAKMGEAVMRFGLSKEETNPEQFAKGFMKGLEGDSLENAKAQEVLENRMNPEGGPSETTEEAHKVAYFMGLSAINSLAQVVEIPKSDFDEKNLAEGFKDANTEQELRLETSYMDSIFQAYIEPKAEAYRVELEAQAELKAQAMIAAGQAFLEENKKKEGVITTKSGLQYEVIKEGTGPQPTLEDRVKTHYHGTLIDGTVFDSSVDRGQPATFGVNQVIMGWQEGIPLMKEGAKYRLYIPQELGYGMSSPTPSIPAGSVLIFEVELIKVNPE
ncbi:MAG: FKBP-type peptidyl-prolyl cis-trans isomerase [Aureispira sp.]